MHPGLRRLGQQTAAAFVQFEHWFGRPCRTLTNHSSNRENIYWGSARISGLNRHVYNLLTRFRHRNRFVGHVNGSDLFWGDICKERQIYVRNFQFRDLNTLRACPLMPYHDEDRPFVRAWFASTDGHDAPYFVQAIREEHQDRLEEEGGACIMYTSISREASTRTAGCTRSGRGCCVALLRRAAGSCRSPRCWTTWSKNVRITSDQSIRTPGVWSGDGCWTRSGSGTRNLVYVSFGPQGWPCRSLPR